MNFGGWKVIFFQNFRQIEWFEFNLQGSFTATSK